MNVVQVFFLTSLVSKCISRYIRNQSTNIIQFLSLLLNLAAASLNTRPELVEVGFEVALRPRGLQRVDLNAEIGWCGQLRKKMALK